MCEYRCCLQICTLCLPGRRIYTVYSNGKQKTAYFTKLHLYRERFIWLVFVTETCSSKAFPWNAGNRRSAFLLQLFCHLFRMMDTLYPLLKKNSNIRFLGFFLKCVRGTVDVLVCVTGELVCIFIQD